MWKEAHDGFTYEHVTSHGCIWQNNECNKIHNTMKKRRNGKAFFNIFLFLLHVLSTSGTLQFFALFWCIFRIKSLIWEKVTQTSKLLPFAKQLIHAPKDVMFSKLFIQSSKSDTVVVSEKEILEQKTPHLRQQKDNTAHQTCSRLVVWIKL